MKTRGKKNAADAAAMMKARPWYDNGKGAERDNVTDALTNLIHYCAQRTLNFEAALSAARDNSHAEMSLDLSNSRWDEI